MTSVYKLVSLISLVVLVDACNFSLPQIDCSTTNSCDSGTSSSTSSSIDGGLANTELAAAVDSIRTTSNLDFITISWDEAANANTYTIKRRVENSDYVVISDFASSPFTDSDSKLQPGTNYYYAIVSVNLYGNTQSKDFLVTTPNPILIQEGDGQTSLTWNEAPGLVYTLSRGSSEGNYDTILNSNAHSPYTDSNLTNDQTYYYQLSSVDASGLNISSVTAKATPALHTNITSNTIIVTNTNINTSTGTDANTDTGTSSNTNTNTNSNTDTASSSDTDTASSTGTNTNTMLAWQNSIQLGVRNQITNSNAIATDLADNVYIAGATSGGLDGHSLQGVTDIFVSKYNSQGVKQWTSQIGSSNNTANAFGIAASDSGSVYIVGNTTRSINNNGQHGFRDAFVAKLNTQNGSIEWSQQIGALFATTAGFGISLDAAENVYISGYTNQGLFNVHQRGQWDAFVIKFDKFGSFQWNKQLGSRGGTTASFNLKTDQNGNVLLAGYTNIGIEGHAQAGFFDIFVAKISGAGNLVWTQQMGASGGSSAAVAIDSDLAGNVYLSGYTNIALNNNMQAGTWDLVLAKLDAAGSVQWIRQAGATGGDTEGLALIVTKDTFATIYVTGLTDVGLGQNTKQGSYDAFIQAYDSSGSTQWTQELGVSGATTEAYGIARDENANLYITGYTSSALGSATQTGTYDAFITKYDSLGNLQ